MSQSLSRGLQLLTLLDQGGRGLADLATEVGVHKSTVLRLLRTLEEERFVRRDDDHRFHIGSRLVQLGDARLQQIAVRDVAAPHLRRLARVTGGQAVHLAVLEDDHAVYVDKVESIHPVRMYSRIGLPAPLHCTAVGKVLLAALPRRRRDALVQDLDLRAWTGQTITDVAALRAELDAVAERGWAEDAAEHETFINCVAAPVHDAAGRVVAALSVSVPDVILDHERILALVPEVRAAAESVDAEHTHPERPQEDLMPDRTEHPEDRNQGDRTIKAAVRTDAAPAPAAAFSQGVRKGPLLQVSGQGPVDPASGEYLHPGDVGAQTTRTLQNVRAVLEAGGATMADVVMLRVYLTDAGDFAAMNEAYGAFVAEFVPDGAPPARTTVFTGLPREEMLVEIDALAVV